MLFNSRYRYYEFFFTHLGQTLSNTLEGLKVKDWLRINIEHTDEKYIDTRPLAILTSDSVFHSSGILTISVPDGSYMFDSSVKIPNNINEYRTNTSYLPINDFTRIWKTPLIKKRNLNDNVLDTETFGTNQATESDSLFSEIFFGDADFSEDYLTENRVEPPLTIDTFTYRDNRFIETREYPKVIKSPKSYDEEKDIWKLYTADSAIVTDIDLDNNKKFIRQDLLQVPISSNNIIEYEENKTKRILPCKLEASEVYKNPISDYSWVAFTVDAAIKNNQRFIGDNEFITQPRSTTGSYFIKLPPYTFDIVSPPENLLTTDLLPVGLTTVEYKSSDSISKCWSGINRGYTPADFLTTEMNAGKTINVAISILTLIGLKEDRLLVLVIRELTYLWKYVLNNVVNNEGVEEVNDDAIPGFPPTIPRVLTDRTHSCLLESRRTTLDNAWLGYAITKAATYLADRKVEDRITLSKDVKKILDQLANFVAGCISPAIGLCTPGYDEFGYLIAEMDYQASVMASVFLRSYLTVEYSNFVHGKATRLKIILDSIYELDKIAELDTRLDSNLISLYSYLLIYVYINKYQYRLSNITTTLVDTLNKVDALTKPASLEDITFSIYVLERTKIKYNLSFALLDVYLNNIKIPRKVDSGLYAVENETFPSLLTSSLTILKELNVDLFNNYYFNLLDSEAELLSSVSYNSGLTLYPYGYGWLNNKILRNTTSAVGSLIYSAAYSTFDTACYISLLKSSVSVRSSQGSLLNAWGDSIRRPRPLFMSDFYYRNYVAKEMVNSLNIASYVAFYINDYFGNDIILYNPLLPETIYSFINDEWVELEIDTSEYTKALLRGNFIEPGFYKKSGNDYVFVKWKDFNSKLYVISIGYYKGLYKEITQSLSTGVKADIRYYLPFTEIRKDTTYLI